MKSMGMLTHYACERASAFSLLEPLSFQYSLRVFYLIAFLGLVNVPISSQIYLTPGVAMAYSKFEWANFQHEYKVASYGNTHISPGLGLLYKLGDNYSLRLHGALYKGRYQVNDAVGFNPVESIHHSTLDSDISLSRKLGKSIVFGLGFKHLLFYNVTIDRMGPTDEQYNTVNGLGYHLHFAYELDRFGVLLAYNGLYNYKGVDTSVAYKKSTTLDLHIYYKVSIFSTRNKRRQ